MAEVSWTPQALSDLEAVFLFVARDSPHYAAVLTGRLFQATDRLHEHPSSGRTVPEMNRDDEAE